MHDIKNNSKLVYIIYNVRYSLVKNSNYVLDLCKFWGGDDTIVGTNTETKVRKLQSNVKSNTDVEALKIWNIN